MHPLKGLNEFSVTEKRGLFALSLIIVLFGGYVFTYRYWAASQKIDYQQYKAQIIALQNEDSIQKANVLKEPSNLFLFDPNIANQEVWVQLGFSEKQAKSILNYRNKVGSFRQKEDILKLYVVDSQKYRELEPFIQLSVLETAPKERYENERNNNSHQEEKEFQQTKEKSKVEIINVNLASEIELQKIKGIGQTYASRIVKYRKVLGGFYSTLQLKEVYGIDEEKWMEVKEQIQCKGAINKININTCTAYDLQKHPYIKNWDFPNKIISYREKQGAFKEVSDIYKIENLNQEQARKIEPYLIVK